MTAALLAVIIGVFVGINYHNNKQIKEQLKVASAELQEGKYEQAIKSFSKVIEIDDNNAQAYEGRGDAYVKTKKPKKAVPDYHKAIENNEEETELYRKGIDACLQYDDIKEANKFMEEMKENVSKEKAEEVWKDEFGKVAKMALEKQLRDLRTETVEVDDSADMALEESAYFDMDGDGIEELITVRRTGEGSGRILRAFAYRDGETMKILEEAGYGFSRIEAYETTKAIVLYRSGHGGEGYSYYENGDGEYKFIASRGREAVAGGSEKDGGWSYSASGDKEDDLGQAISEDKFNSLIKELVKGKSRKTEYEDWDNEWEQLSDDDLTKHIELELKFSATRGRIGYSTVHAKNSRGKTVWSYKSKEYEQAQIDGVCVGIKDKYVYVNDAGTMVKLKKTTGKVIKRSEEKLNGIYNITGDGKGNVYVIAFPNKVAKYDDDLHIKWKKDIEAEEGYFELSDFDIYDDKVYVRYSGEEEDGSISLDPETGEQIEEE